MNFKRVIEISIHRVFRNRKRNLIIGIPVIIVMILLLIVNSIQYSTKKYIEKISNNIELRSIDGICYTELNAEQIMKQLQEIPHIDMVIDMYERQIYADEYCEQLKTEVTNGYTYIQPINIQTCPNVIKGRMITEEDEYAIILPNKIFANGAINDEYNNAVEKKDIEKMCINGENLIGSKITIEFQKDENKLLEKSFEVIGIYDSEQYNSTETLYIPKTTIKEINKELKYEPKDLFIKVVVDKIENLQEVEEKIIQNGLKNQMAIQKEASNNYDIVERNIATATNLKIETQNSIKKLLIFFISTSIIIFIILLVITNINKTYLDTRELGILKVEGYTNKQIQAITILENIFICLISIAISLFLFEFLKIIFEILSNYIIEKDTLSITINELKEQIFYIKKIPQKLNLILVAINGIFISVIVVINTFLINKRILSKNLNEIIK